MPISRILSPEVHFHGQKHTIIFIQRVAEAPAKNTPRKLKQQTKFPEGTKGWSYSGDPE
jgi:diaminopimelate epimerase